MKKKCQASVDSRRISTKMIFGLGMKEGQETGPIAGNSSAFIIKNVKFTVPAETTNYSDIVREKTSQFTNKVGGGAVYNALRNQAKIKDNRTDIF